MCIFYVSELFFFILSQTSLLGIYFNVNNFVNVWPHCPQLPFVHPSNLLVLYPWGPKPVNRMLASHPLVCRVSLKVTCDQHVVFTATAFFLKWHYSYKSVVILISHNLIHLWKFLPRLASNKGHILDTSSKHHALNFVITGICSSWSPKCYFITLEAGIILVLKNRTCPNWFIDSYFAVGRSLHCGR